MILYYTQRHFFLIIKSLISTVFLLCAKNSSAETDATLWMFRRHNNVTMPLFQTRPKSDIQKWMTVFKEEQNGRFRVESPEHVPGLI
jgi:hypothetical protein